MSDDPRIQDATLCCVDIDHLDVQRQLLHRLVESLSHSVAARERLGISRDDMDELDGLLRALDDWSDRTMTAPDTHDEEVEPVRMRTVVVVRQEEAFTFEFAPDDPRVPTDEHEGEEFFCLLDYPAGACAYNSVTERTVKVETVPVSEEWRRSWDSRRKPYDVTRLSRETVLPADEVVPAGWGWLWDMLDVASDVAWGSHSRILVRADRFAEQCRQVVEEDDLPDEVTAGEFLEFVKKLVGLGDVYLRLR